MANLSDCFLRRVVQCKTTLQKWYSKVYFPFPTAVCGVTGTFTITFDGTLMFFERLYSTLFERAKYYFKKKQTA